MKSKGLFQHITTMAMTASLFLAGCYQPMEPEVFVSDTVPNIGCEADFKKSLFDNIFRNLSQGKALPTADELSPYLSSQLNKLKTTESGKADHLAQIKAAYLNVYDVILRYRDQDLGLPGSYGHWLADIENGNIFNDQQKEWAEDLNRALQELDSAAQVLNVNCAPESTAPSTPSAPISNDAFFLSVETLTLRGPEAQTYIQERQNNAYISRGYLQTPARIYTDTASQDSSSQPPASNNSVGGQQISEEPDVVANHPEGEENLTPAPSHWTPLIAHNTTINILPPNNSTTPTPTPVRPTAAGNNSPYVDNLFRSYHPVFAGALKTMAVVYQSCNVLDLPLVDNSAPRLEGLRRVGRDRIYNKPLYEIADPNRFADRHYYLARLDQSHDNSQAQCRNTRDEYQTMYVYSGQASVTTVEKGNDFKEAINVFAQASASAIEPGMDCSAFVSVALQAGGLKYKSSGTCRAYERLGSTIDLINYKRHNFNCLFEPQSDEVNTNSSTGPVDLAPGDIFTVGNYHTVIIGQTAYDGEIPDPFNLRRFQDISQCKLENFQYRDFQFDIIHSSATRSQANTAPDTGLGVARHHASSYFATDPTMGEHLRRYAVHACKRKFDPSTPPYRNSNMNVLRHLPTADCMCEEPTLLFKESCLASCPVPGEQ